MTLPCHPLANIFPLIEGAEFEELCASIKANGLRDPIVVHDGMVLDGRNRQRACDAVGVDCVYVPLAADDDALEYVWDKNFRRRHLSTGQISYALAQYETLRHGGARRHVQDANLQVEQPQETRADLAAKGGVSERSVASAAVVRDHGVEELKSAVERGDLAISVAEKIARLPEPEQPAAVERALPNGSRAIMSSRQEPDDSLDYFPTPPWATRALIEVVLRGHWNIRPYSLKSAWEPACGEGHMAEVLREYFPDVSASDIHDYGYGDANVDFLNPGLSEYSADWFITNPPFGDKAEAFTLRAIAKARVGVAMFVRLQWLETIGRFESIFKPHPPALIAQFSERVPLCKGRWNPDGDTATAYLWIIWLNAERSGRTEFMWIPPGQRDALTRADDRERFTAQPVIKKVHDHRDPHNDSTVTEERIPDHDSVVTPPPSESDFDIPDFLRRETV